MRPELNPVAARTEFLRMFSWRGGASAELQFVTADDGHRWRKRHFTKNAAGTLPAEHSL
jgi:hypothetical protein